MIYPTVKTEEKAVELVLAKAKKLGLKGSFLDIVTVECSGGQTQAAEVYNRGISITCAWDDAEGDDDAFESDVVVVS